MQNEITEYEQRRRCLRALANGLGHGGIAQIAAGLGKNPSYVSRMLLDPSNKEHRNITGETVLALNELYPGWLLLSDSTQNDAAGVAYKDAPLEPGPSITGWVPLISWIQAGTWHGIVDNFAPGDAEDWLPCIERCGPRSFVLRNRGISMHNPLGKPSYDDGDLVFFDPDLPAEHGSCVAVRLEGKKEATFKQLIIEGDERYLRPLNPEWQPRLIPITEDATICGVAFGKWVPS